jgi:hypothetical protein
MSVGAGVGVSVGSGVEVDGKVGVGTGVAVDNEATIIGLLDSTSNVVICSTIGLAPQFISQGVGFDQVDVIFSSSK